MKYTYVGLLLFSVFSQTATAFELSENSLQLELSRCESPYERWYSEPNKSIPKDFFTATCQWYQGQRVQSSISEQESLLNLIQTAQNSGLKESVYNFSRIVEGLTYCRLADMKKAGETTSEVEKFCGYRTAAADVFGNFEWTRTLYTFNDDSKVSFQGLVDQVSQCFAAGALSENYDSRCQETERLSQTALNSAVDDATHSSLDFYLGDGEEKSKDNPLAQVMERKLLQAEAASNNLTQKLTKVEDSSLLAKTSIEVLQTYYDELLPIVNDALEYYRTSYKRAVGTQAAFKDWENGLTREGDTDYKEAIAGRNTESISYQVNQWMQANDQGESIRSIKTRMDQVADIELTMQSRLNRMCKIYFCEVARSRPVFAQNQIQPYLAACQHPENAGNPLCGTQAGDIYLDDSDISLIETCSQAGFDTEAFGKIQQELTRSQQTACFQ